jgi:hypothetical protein
MNFLIKIYCDPSRDKTQNQNKVAHQIKEKNYGLDLYDQILEDLNKKKLIIPINLSPRNLSCFKNNIEFYNTIYFETQNEELIKQISLFKSRYKIDIQIDPFMLTPFIFWKYQLEYYEKEIQYIQFSLNLHTELILKAWIEAGCPSHWSWSEEKINKFIQQEMGNKIIFYDNSQNN